MHLTGRQIEDYRQRALPPRELLEVDDHLAACPECRLRVAEGEPLSGAFAAWEEVTEEPAPTSVRLDLGEILDEVEARDARNTRDTRRQRARSWRPALWAASLLLLAGGVFWTVTRPEPANPWGQPQGPVLRGPVSAPAFTLQAPLSTEVPGGRPTFRWTPLAGAESYKVMVFDGDFNRVADSGPLSATEWTPDRPLPKGTYTWQVRARRGGSEITAPGPASPQAFFRVVDSG
jgi:hypothetical protein